MEPNSFSIRETKKLASSLVRKLNKQVPGLI